MGLPSIWKLKLGEMSVDQIKRAVWKSADLDWPPSAGGFQKLGTDSGFDYDASFDRFIARESLNDIEFFAKQEVGFACRGQLSEKDARKKWTAAIKKYEQRRQEGTLPQRNQKAIAHTDVKVKADWLAPDGNMYTCPAEYYAKKIKGGEK